MNDEVMFYGGRNSAQEVIEWAKAHGWNAWWSEGMSSANRGGITPENVQIDDDSVVVPAVHAGQTARAVDGALTISDYPTLPLTSHP